MKAKDFYRILSRVQGMEWQLVSHARPSLAVPATTTFIRGTRHSFRYSPESAVASAVRRSFVDPSNRNINGILRLDRRTYRRIHAALHQEAGYSPVVHRKLLQACGMRVSPR